MISKIPENLIVLFRKNSLSEIKLNEEIVRFVLSSRSEWTISFEDLAEQFSVIKALFRLWEREEVGIKQNRISTIMKIKDVKVKAVKKEIPASLDVQK